MKLYNSPRADLVRVETADIVTFSLGELFNAGDIDISSYFSGTTSDEGNMQ